MKKIYALILVLFVNYSLQAQDDPDLLGTWYLHYIETNGSTLAAPSEATFPLEISSSINIEPIFGFAMCNGFSSSYQILNNNSSIQLTNYSETLALCEYIFESIYLSIVGNHVDNTFDYTIDLTNETLTMINALGKKLVYGRQVLSTKDNEAFSNSIKVYPNPAKNELSLTGISTNSKISYSIYNTLGNIVISERSLTQTSLNVTQLKAGVYFIKFQQHGKTAVKKFVKI